MPLAFFINPITYNNIKENNIKKQPKAKQAIIFSDLEKSKSFSSKGLQSKLYKNYLLLFLFCYLHNLLQSILQIRSKFEAKTHI